MLILYIGPETLMPLASIFAAITGIVLLFWRKLKSAAKTTASFIRQKLNAIRSS